MMLQSSGVDEEHYNIDLSDPPSNDSVGSLRTESGNLKDVPWWMIFMRWGFQCILTLLVMSFSMGLCVYDIAVHNEPTSIFNTVFPLIATTMALHFQLKTTSRGLRSAVLSRRCKFRGQEEKVQTTPEDL